MLNSNGNAKVVKIVSKKKQVIEKLRRHRP